MFLRSAVWRTNNLQFLKRGVGLLPHPEKIGRGGEDSYVLTEDVIGVADGVGEHFATKGIDAGEYSRALTRSAFEYVSDTVAMSPERLDIRRLLKEATQNASAIRGSSTLTLGLLTHDQIQVGQLGDSGLQLLRGGRVIYRTKDMHHSLNHPYQLGDGGLTTYRDSFVARIRVQSGDLVFCASDGVLDNLFEGQLLRLFMAGCLGKPYPEDLPSLIPAEELASEEDRAQAVEQQLPKQWLNILRRGRALPYAFRERLRGSLRGTGSSPSSENTTATSGADCGNGNGAAASSHSAHTVDAVLGDPLAFKEFMVRLKDVEMKQGIDYVMRAATSNANDEKTITPFAQKCLQEGIRRDGGKLDDITFAVGVILRKSDLAHGIDRFDQSLTVAPDPFWGYPYDPESPKLHHTGGYTAVLA